MRAFSEIEQLAAARKGGMAHLEQMLPQAKSPAALAAIGDDRYLAEMTRRIFQAGFVWRVIDQKWAGFEAAFYGFDPQKVALFSMENFEVLMKDERIVRHGQKIQAVTLNAQFLLDLAREHGSAARFFADWPVTEIVGLWQLLKERGNRLGGNTGAYFLRFIGKDTFILSADVVAALVREGVVTRRPTGKRDLLRVQAAFNSWHAESGRPLCQLSRILSYSVDG